MKYGDFPLITREELTELSMLKDHVLYSDEIEDMLCDYSLVTGTIRAVKGQEEYDDFLCEI